MLSWLHPIRWKTISIAVCLYMFVTASWAGADSSGANCSLVSGIMPEARNMKYEWLGLGGFVASVFIVAGILIWLVPSQRTRDLGGKLMGAAVVFAIVLLFGLAFASKAIPLPCSII